MIVPKVEWRIDAGLGNSLNPHQKLAVLVYVQNTEMCSRTRGGQRRCGSVGGLASLGIVREAG